MEKWMYCIFLILSEGLIWMDLVIFGGLYLFSFFKIFELLPPKPALFFTTSLDFSRSVFWCFMNCGVCCTSVVSPNVPKNILNCLSTAVANCSYLKIRCFQKIIQYLLEATCFWRSVSSCSQPIASWNSVVFLHVAWILDFNYAWDEILTLWILCTWCDGFEILLSQPKSYWVWHCLDIGKQI